MPLYEYQCAACHRRTEKIQKFSDPELTVCPYCGGPLARTLTAPAVHFAGGGWYKDLYSSAKPPAAGGAGEGSAAPAAGEGGSTPPAGGGDSAPAAATPAASTSPASAAPAASAPPSSAPASKPGG